MITPILSICFDNLNGTRNRLEIRMRTSYPEEEVRLGQENEQIGKIYELLRSGYSLREILNGGGTAQTSRGVDRSAGEANSSLPATQERIDYDCTPSNFVTHIDE